MSPGEQKSLVLLLKKLSNLILLLSKQTIRGNLNCGRDSPIQTMLYKRTCKSPNVVL